jgi:hypothetical protein
MRVRTGRNKIDTSLTKSFELCSGDNTFKKKNKFHKPNGKARIPIKKTNKPAYPPATMPAAKIRTICRIKLIIKYRKNFHKYTGKENCFIILPF